MSTEGIFGHASIDPTGDYRQAKDRQRMLLGAAAEYHAGSGQDTTINITPTQPKTEKRLLRLVPRAVGVLAVLFGTSCVPGEMNTTSVLTQPEPTSESVPMKPMIDTGMMDSRVNENPMVPIISQGP